MKKRLLLVVTLLSALFSFVWLTRESQNLTPLDSRAEPESLVIHELANNGADFARVDVSQHDPDPHAAFHKWIDRYRSASSSPADAAMIQQGIEAAKERQTVMKMLIRENPREAIARALPADLREELPPEIHPYLEKTVSGRGDLYVSGVVPKLNGEVPERLVQRDFKINGQHYDAYVSGEWLGVPVSDNIFAHGIAIERDLAVAESPARILGAREIEALGGPSIPCPPEMGEHEAADANPVVAETARGIIEFCCAAHYLAFTDDPVNRQPLNHETATYSSLGEKTILVVRVEFAEPEEPDDPDEPEEPEEPTIPPDPPVSESAAYTVMEQVSRFLQEASYRQFRFRQIHVTAGQPLRMPGTAAAYLADGEDEPGYLTLLRDAVTAAQGLGYESEYDFVLVAFPDIGFDWAGLGGLGRGEAWIQGIFHPGVIAHELGHNFGLHHSGYWAPVGPQSAGTYPVENARFIEYGNVFDVMGVSDNFPNNHYSGNFKHLIQWLTTEDIAEIGPGTEPGSYRLFRLDGGAAKVPGRVYSLRILTENHSMLPPLKDYWVDFRQLFTSSERAMDGVVVQWGDAPGTDRGSHLLNLNPDLWPESSAEEAPLRVGESYVDQENELILTAARRGGTGTNAYVDVVVTRGQLSTSVLSPEPPYSTENPEGEVRLLAAGTVTVRMSANATASPVASVDLLLDGDSVGIPEEVGDGIYELSIPATGWPDARMELRSAVKNEAGNIVYSDPVLVRFVEPEIVLAAEPAEVFLGEPINFSVQRAEGDGPLEPGEIFIGGESAGMLDASLAMTWIPEESGLFEVYATAFDADEILIRTRSIDVRVFSGEVAEFDIEVTPEVVVLGGAADLLIATTGDYVTSLKYSINGEVLEEPADAAEPVVWRPMVPGEYEIGAVAMVDGIEVSTTRMISVVEAEEFFFEFTVSPPSITLGESVDLLVSSDETISGVEYWLNGEVFSRVDEAPFTAAWNPVHPGTYEFRAAVTGESGTVASRLIPVSVQEPVILVQVEPRILLSSGEITVEAQTNATSWEAVEVQYRINGAPLDGAIGFGQAFKHFLNIPGKHSVEVRAMDGAGNEAVGRGYAEVIGRTPMEATDSAVIGSGNLYAGVGGEAGVVFGGVEGIWIFDAETGDWANQPVPFTVRGLSYGNGVYVAVGDAGQAAWSADGILWQEIPSGTNSHLRSVRWYNGLFHAVGDQGIILYSLDGTVWHRANSPDTNNTLWDLSYGLGRWIAVGQAGMILTSENGTDWTAQSAQTTIALRGIAFGKGTFVAVGGRVVHDNVTEGIILLSFDGESWQPQSRSEILRGAAFVDQSFIVTGDRGTILGSYDGVRWTSSITETLLAFFGVVDHEGLLTAFGESGQVWTTQPGGIASSYGEWVGRGLNANEIEDPGRVLPEAAVDGTTTNLERYAFGIDPREPVSIEALPRMIRTADNRLGLIYRQSLHPDDIQVKPQVSSDLVDWTPLGEEAVVALVEEENFREVTVDDRHEPAAARRFIRLKIDLTGPQ